MKFSVPDWCFLKKEYEPKEYYRRLKEIGCGAVEMVAPERWPIARAAGLEIINLAGPGMQKGLNRPDHHAELIPQIRKAIDDARAGGIPHVIVFSGNREGQTDAEGQAVCAGAFKELLPAAKAVGVTLAFEMLNSHDHKDYQADTSRYGFDLARQMNSPSFKVVYDIYHIARMGEEILPALTANLPLVAHLHVAEIPTRTKPAANGRVDYRKIVREVEGAGYRGYWGMEFIPKQDSLQELKEARDLFQSFVG